MAIDMRLIFTVILAVHGIGHLMGVISIVGGLITSPGFTSNSWLLTDRLGFSETLVRALGLIWLAPTVGFVVAAYGYWSDLAWWRPLTWIMIVLSVGVLVVWFDAFTDMRQKAPYTSGGRNAAGIPRRATFLRNVTYSLVSARARDHDGKRLQTASD